MAATEGTSAAPATSCDMRSLVFWTEPARTAVVFLPTLAILVALSISSVLSVASNTALLTLFAVLVLKAYGFLMEKLGKPNPLACVLKSLHEVNVKVSVETVQYVATLLVKDINELTTHLKKILLVEDLMETLKFGALCYFLSYIGAMFNALTLVIIAFVLTFTLPKLYLNNQAVADDVLGKVMVQVEAVKAKLYQNAASVKQD